MPIAGPLSRTPGPTPGKPGPTVGSHRVADQRKPVSRRAWVRRSPWSDDISTSRTAAMGGTRVCICHQPDGEDALAPARALLIAVPLGLLCWIGIAAVLLTL